MIGKRAGGGVETTPIVGQVLEQVKLATVRNYPCRYSTVRNSITRLRTTPQDQSGQGRVNRRRKKGDRHRPNPKGQARNDRQVSRESRENQRYSRPLGRRKSARLRLTCYRSRRGRGGGLEAVQARATNLIPSIRHLGYVRRLERLNLYSLEKRRLRGQLIEAFKMLKGVNNIDYRHLFTFSNNWTRSNGWKHPVSVETSLHTRLPQYGIDYQPRL